MLVFLSLATAGAQFQPWGGNTDDDPPSFTYPSDDDAGPRHTVSPIPEAAISGQPLGAAGGKSVTPSGTPVTGGSTPTSTPSSGGTTTGTPGEGSFGTPGTDLSGNSTITTTGEARMDTDGTASGGDLTHQGETSWKPGGQSLDASKDSYVVSNGNLASQGVKMGDWAKITNNQTGQSSWARVGDFGNNGETEASTAALHSVGLSTGTDSVGDSSNPDPTITITYYPGSSGQSH